MFKHFLIALPLMLLFAAPSTLLAADAAKGKELYMKRCKVCHAEDGAGTPAMQKKYPKMLPLGGAEVQKKTDAGLKKEILEASNHKAIAKALTPEDVDNLTAFVRTLKK
jgi:cytochrome c553